VLACRYPSACRRWRKRRPTITSRLSDIVARLTKFHSPNNLKCIPLLV
jgi:hypothetical protein